jgi:hypothetical protein
MVTLLLHLEDSLYSCPALSVFFYPQNFFFFRKLDLFMSNFLKEGKGSLC